MNTIVISTAKHHVCTPTYLVAIALHQFIAPRIANLVMAKINRDIEIQSAELSKEILDWLAPYGTSAQKAKTLENTLNYAKIIFAAKTGKVLSGKAEKFNWKVAATM